MDTFTIVYIDNALDPDKDTLENRTLSYLTKTFKSPDTAVLSFFRLNDAKDYFLDQSNGCDLLISDQNLWWGEQENGSHTYRDANTFVSFVLEKRPDLKSTPIIVYTDSPSGVKNRWKGDGIDIKNIVEKYNYDPNDPRKHWEILADNVRILLPSNLREGNIKKER